MIKPDTFRNIGMYANPCVLCVSSGLQYTLINVTTFHI